MSDTLYNANFTVDQTYLGGSKWEFTLFVDDGEGSRIEIDAWYADGSGFEQSMLAVAGWVRNTSPWGAETAGVAAHDAGYHADVQAHGGYASAYGLANFGSESIVTAITGQHAASNVTYFDTDHSAPDYEIVRVDTGAAVGNHVHSVLFEIGHNGSHQGNVNIQWANSSANGTYVGGREFFHVLHGEEEWQNSFTGFTAADGSRSDFELSNPAAYAAIALLYVNGYDPVPMFIDNPINPLGSWAESMVTSPTDATAAKNWLADVQATVMPTSSVMHWGGEATESCAGYCGGYSADGCWCDSLCCGYGDCCPDQASVCGEC